MIKLYFFTFKKFFKSIWFNRNNYRLKLNLFSPFLQKSRRGTLLHIISLALLISLSTSCNTTEPPSNQTLTLKLEDVSCTEAWVQLTTNNLQLPTTINILKNNSVAQTFSLSKSDTLIYIDSLFPNQTYKFKVALNTTNNPQPTTNEVLAQTMDTTSHNFTWQTFTFGEAGAGSSTLYDVAIIDENNIWAVGEIYMNDSLGNPDPNLYNLIKWDGISWKLERDYYNYQGSNFIAPLHSIFTFAINDVWVGSNQPMRWNGNVWQKWDLLGNIWNGWINKIWASSSNDLYIVGNNGNIAHYQNGSWKKIESGTTSIINDVWGIMDNQSNVVLYCPVSSFFVPGDKKILKIVEYKVDSVTWNRDVRLYSAWAQNENFLYVCGEGVYVNKFGSWSQIDLPSVGTNSVRGNNINDIIVVGDNGFITHFNGVSWKVLSTFSDKGYSKVCIKGDIVAICGNHQGRGIIEIGKRN